MLNKTIVMSGEPHGVIANPGADQRMKPAAREFEACLMKEFLEPLQHDGLFADDEGGESAENSNNALMSFGSEALAKAISERGGFGIAEKIIRHFAKAGSTT